VRGGLPGPEVWLVLRRSLPEPSENPELKYYLSNAPADTPLATPVRVSGLRWPIESCFEEGKDEVGLDHWRQLGSKKCSIATIRRAACLGYWRVIES
jgi:SRSO17 transposase